MATHAAPSSRSLEWDTYIEQDTALQAVAEHIWRVSQVLNETTGYSGVREMIAINQDFPYSVGLQAKRLADLKNCQPSLMQGSQQPKAVHNAVFKAVQQQDRSIKAVHKAVLQAVKQQRDLHVQNVDHKPSQTLLARL
jgi:hypothetical protein